MPDPVTSPVLRHRCSGVLLHPTSLPGRGIGELGDPAYRFVDWLAGAGQALWQVLPLVPVDEGGSPYNGLSAMAGNPLLLDLTALVEQSLLPPNAVASEEFPPDRVDFAAVGPWKRGLLRQAFASFRQRGDPLRRGEFAEFRERHAAWLDDYALFQAVREHHGGRSWMEWDRPIRMREPAALREWRESLADEIERHAWEQFVFDRQWSALRDRTRARGIRIVGDVPIFVALDSADVWAHRELFQLDDEGRPEAVSGVPPDYFSETGQRWGNPLYRWDVMEERGFRWWTERFRRTLELVDLARIDHFRGFESYWAIPADEETAIHGEWRSGPGAALFHALERELGPLPLIAEDLGLITPAVEELRDSLGLPGMRVLQFAFDGDARNPHHPANHAADAVAYTGTHDNDTTLGWWNAVGADVRKQARRAGGAEMDGEVHWAMIRLAFESPAHFAVAPLQDVLGLGTEARMNTPGTGPGNWEWRYTEDQLTNGVQHRLLQLTRATGREHSFSPLPETPVSART